VTHLQAAVLCIQIQPLKLQFLQTALLFCLLTCCHFQLCFGGCTALLKLLDFVQQILTTMQHLGTHACGTSCFKHTTVSDLVAILLAAIAAWRCSLLAIHKLLEHTAGCA